MALKSLNAFKTLAEQKGAVLKYGIEVKETHENYVTTSDGDRINTKLVIVTAGP